MFDCRVTGGTGKCNIFTGGVSPPHQHPTALFRPLPCFIWMCNGKDISPGSKKGNQSCCADCLPYKSKRGRRPCLLISSFNIQSELGEYQLTSTPSLAATRCRCTRSCSSSSWLGCQSRHRMRSMFRAYIVWEGITPWWTCITQRQTCDHADLW